MVRPLDKTQRPEEEAVSSTLPSVPTLRILYRKEQGVLREAARPLASGATRIGRAVPTSELNIESDGQASREHAALLYRPGQPPRLRDLNSSNGTFKNGARVQECELSDGDLVRVGTTLMLLRIEPPPPEDAAVPSLLGQSAAMRRLRREIHLMAPSLATVLVLGESGTGKEVSARALHDLSGVKGPLVSVNCAAIPESLAESQLFGHVSGAFTGAQAQPGYFRSADGGTLFLDEVGELPMTLQPKLLRVLEDGVVTPVGSVTPKPCKVRLITATNRELRQAVDGGKMRGDLYARLAELVLVLPPLRTRREDILLLLADALGPEVPPLSPRLAEALLLYDWPFNVRELRKIATELRVRGAGADSLSLDLVAARLSRPESATPPPPPPASPQASVATPKPVSLPTAEELRTLLVAHRGKVSAIAQALGRSRTQTYRLLEEFGLDPEAFRGH